MDIIFILAQVFGIIAWLLLATSYYRENTDRILFVQILSIIFYCLNYLFLGAFTGIIVIIIELIRDYLYYKSEKDDLVFLFTIPLYVVLAYFAKNNFIELIPILASVFEGFTLTKKKKTVVIGALFVYSLWVVYDLQVLSYTGAITDAIIVITNISVLTSMLIKHKQIDDFKIHNYHHTDKETFKKIFELDKVNYHKKLLWDPNDIENIYQKNKDTITYIKYKNEIIGYISYLILSKEKYEDILELEEYNNKYNEKDILNYNKDEINYIILDSIVINPDYETKKSVKLFSNAINKYMKRIKKKYNLSDVISIGITVFEKDVLKENGFINIKELKDDYILYKKGV